MHWDRLFEDLEGQLASEWESERAALDAESERLRISRLDLRDRLRMLCGAAAPTVVDVASGARIRVRLQTLGADWVAAGIIEAEGARRAPSTRIIPLSAIRSLGVDHGLLLASLESMDTGAVALRERMSLGFVMRDLARRRIAVRIFRADGSELQGTIDRAGADHLDLAIHDAGTARTISAVRDFRVIPFAGLDAVQIAGDHMP
ncbi:hypothetical protein [Microbacterium sp. 1.5R]|uniref:hypothetical protein n=1 Tax=Microbacterium sp. 1.5R TaxID=1916917 RepID=UPI0011A961D8|nr:hypothetical protein [Microbacterium sp. 1.5R]